MTVESDNAAAAAAAASAAAAAAAAGGAKPWYDGADPALIAHLSTHGWDKKSEKEAALAAAQSHFQAQKLVGVSPDQLLRMPKDANDADGWQKVYEKLGVPKEYKFEGLKFADGKEPEKSYVDFIAQTAKDLHLTQNAAQDLAQRLIKSMDAAVAEETAEETAARQLGVDELKKAWGPNWDAHMFVAQRAAQSLGVTPEQLAELQTGVGYPKVMEMFRSIAAKLGEDTIVRQDGPNGGAIMTRDQAAGKRAELLADKAWAQRYTEGGKKELAEMTALNTIIVGKAA